jgi:hypothetical protein
MATEHPAVCNLTSVLPAKLDQLVRWAIMLVMLVRDLPADLTNTESHSPSGLHRIRKFSVFLETLHSGDSARDTPFHGGQ